MIEVKQRRQQQRQYEQWAIFEVTSEFFKWRLKFEAILRSSATRAV
jgi:hypothetical protein